jgi:hypothetical protein
VGCARIHERIGFEVNRWQACSVAYFLNAISAVLSDDTRMATNRMKWEQLCGAVDDSWHTIKVTPWAVPQQKCDSLD